MRRWLRARAASASCSRRLRRPATAARASTCSASADRWPRSCRSRASTSRTTCTTTTPAAATCCRSAIARDHVVQDVSAQALMDIPQFTWVTDVAVAGGRLAFSAAHPVRQARRGRQGHGGLAGRRPRPQRQAFGLGQRLRGPGRGRFGRLEASRRRQVPGLERLFVGLDPDRLLRSRAARQPEQQPLGARRRRRLHDGQLQGRPRVFVGARLYVQRRQPGHRLQQRHGLPPRDVRPSAPAAQLGGRCRRLLVPAIDRRQQRPGRPRRLQGQGLRLSAPRSPTSSRSKAHPVGVDLRWYHEFGAENRVEGDGVFLTLSVPLSIKPPRNASEDWIGHLYESMLKEMRDAAGDSGEFYTPARRRPLHGRRSPTRSWARRSSTPPAAPAASWSRRTHHLEKQCKTVERPADAPGAEHLRRRGEAAAVPALPDEPAAARPGGPADRPGQQPGAASSPRSATRTAWT